MILDKSNIDAFLNAGSPDSPNTTSPVSPVFGISARHEALTQDTPVAATPSIVPQRRLAL